MKKRLWLPVALASVCILHAAPLYQEKFELPLKRSFRISSSGNAEWNYSKDHEFSSNILRIRPIGDVSRLGEVRILQGDKVVYSCSKFTRPVFAGLRKSGTYKVEVKGNSGEKPGHLSFDAINAQSMQMLTWNTSRCIISRNASGNTVMTPPAAGKPGAIYANFYGINPGKWYKVEVVCQADTPTSATLMCSQLIGRKRLRVDRKFEVAPGGETVLVCEFLAETAIVAVDISSMNPLELKSLKIELKESPPEKTRKIGNTTVVFEPRNPLPEPERVLNFPVIFKRPLRKIYQESVPQPFEEISCLETFSAQGDYAVWHFAVHNPKSSTGQIRLSDLKNGKAIIPAKNIKLSFVEFHDFPMGTSNYTNMPEKILPLTDATPRVSGNRIFWLQTRLPDSTLPGLYCGNAEIDCGSKKIVLPIKLRVLPFKLNAPKDMAWVMYADIHYGQRHYYPFETKVQYFKDMADYGITGVHHHLSSGGEKNIATLQKLRKLAGMNGPLILYGAMAEYVACKELGIKYHKDDPWYDDSRICAGFTKRIKDIDRWVKQYGGEGYSDWYYMGHDEPHLRPTLLRGALAQHRMVRDAGFKSMSNVYAPNYVETMAHVIDVSSNLFIGNDADTFNKLMEIGKKRNVEFWYLGGGCYNGQEGGLMPNRLMAGFLSFKTGVKGHISYTYQVADYPVDHFKTGKNYCMTYPSAAKPDPKSPSIFTLMFEGVREGITDYKYMYALKCAIERARQGGRTAAADEGEKVMQEILDRIPFLNDINDDLNGLLQKKHFDNDTADQLRRLAAAAILKLEGNGN